LAVVARQRRDGEGRRLDRRREEGAAVLRVLRVRVVGVLLLLQVLLEVEVVRSVWMLVVVLLLLLLLLCE